MPPQILLMGGANTIFTGKCGAHDNKYKTIVSTAANKAKGIKTCGFETIRFIADFQIETTLDEFAALTFDIIPRKMFQAKLKKNNIF